MQAGQGIVWGDEMRVGLRGQVRKVWAPRGVAVSQAVQIGWKYLYVAVAIDPMTGRLWWAWQKNMKGEEMARVGKVWAEDPNIDGWVWDGAGGHRGEDMQAVDAPQVVQPPYAPELNPVERFFRELRRALEGRVYPDLQAKQEALEPILRAWQTGPERVKKLCGWGWIRTALEALPTAAETP
ncbi:MAG: transposase [Caldilineaceae bacterium]|nr:transposase [Caldilineaceae bacterium]